MQVLVNESAIRRTTAQVIEGIDRLAPAPQDASPTLQALGFAPALVEARPRLGGLENDGRYFVIVGAGGLIKLMFGLTYETAVVLVGIAMIAYVLFGGADFGGGVWDLLASGPRRDRQREVISHAIGPIWEANHVWLILAIVVAAENRVIGEVLLKRVSDAEGVAELGYALARSHQGQGLASEAARAMLDLAFGEFGLQRVTARIDEPNEASRRMIARLGFTEESRSDPNPAIGETEVLVHYSLRRGAVGS